MVATDDVVPVCGSSQERIGHVRIGHGADVAKASTAPANLVGRFKPPLPVDRISHAHTQRSHSTAFKQVYFTPTTQAAHAPAQSGGLDALRQHFNLSGATQGAKGSSFEVVNPAKSLTQGPVAQRAANNAPSLECGGAVYTKQALPGLPPGLPLLPPTSESDPQASVFVHAVLPPRSTAAASAAMTEAKQAARSGTSESHAGWISIPVSNVPTTRVSLDDDSSDRSFKRVRASVTTSTNKHSRHQSLPLSKSAHGDFTESSRYELPDTARQIDIDRSDCSMAQSQSLAALHLDDGKTTTGLMRKAQTQLTLSQTKTLAGSELNPTTRNQEISHPPRDTGSPSSRNAFMPYSSKSCTPKLARDQPLQGANSSFSVVVPQDVASESMATREHHALLDALLHGNSEHQLQAQYVIRSNPERFGPVLDAANIYYSHMQSIANARVCALMNQDPSTPSCIDIRSSWGQSPQQMSLQEPSVGTHPGSSTSNSDSQRTAAFEPQSLHGSAARSSLSGRDTVGQVGGLDTATFLGSKAPGPSSVTPLANLQSHMTELRHMLSHNAHEVQGSGRVSELNLATERALDKAADIMRASEEAISKKNDSENTN